MSEGAGGWLDPSIGVSRLSVNTHVHVPPNFSAFATAEELAGSAAAERIAVLGASNFHDLAVYTRFASAAERHGVLPLFGFEIIAVMDDAERAGMRVNDPDNPGRAYLCGKGIARPAAPTPAASRRLAEARALNVARIRLVADLLAGSLAEAGSPAPLSYEAIVADVASRAGVAEESVVLQERHLARAAQAAIFERLAPEARVALLARAYGAAPTAAPDDPVAVQREIRSRLIKAGGPAFVPESPVSFEAAVELMLELGAIPCYPVLADGAHPVCPWESPARGLARRLADRGIVAAELIPVRNAPDVVDEYVTALRDAGIVVMAGTEHNTADRIPLEPRCADGAPPSEAARTAFAEATCIAVAHQYLRGQGRPGYVDRAGRPAAGFADGEARIRWFRQLGAEIVAGQMGASVA
jgi:hypothetical protein